MSFIFDIAADTGTCSKYGYLHKRWSKTKPVKNATLDCGQDSYALPLTEELLAVDDCWERESYFGSECVGDSCPCQCPSRQ